MRTNGAMRLMAGAALGAGLLLASGCFRPGGPLRSADRFTYVSETWSPKTVSLIDTRTGETLWSIDVPVGQQVVLSFTEGRGPNPEMPDMMVWDVMEAGRTFGTRHNRIAAPGKNERRVDWTLRPAPEYVDLPASAAAE